MDSTGNANKIDSPSNLLNQPKIFRWNQFDYRSIFFMEFSNLRSYEASIKLSAWVFTVPYCLVILLRKVFKVEGV